MGRLLRLFYLYYFGREMLHFEWICSYAEGSRRSDTVHMAVRSETVAESLYVLSAHVVVRQQVLVLFFLYTRVFDMEIVTAV